MKMIITPVVLYFYRMDIELTENYIILRFYVTATNKGQTFEIIIHIPLDSILKYSCLEYCIVYWHH